MSIKDRMMYRKVLTAHEERSTCQRVHVACLIVQDGRNIVSGWNGVASGAEHCCDHFSLYTLEEMQTPEMKQLHREFSVDYELHAEMNCIAFAAKKGISLEGTDMYISYSPCNDCAKAIAACGIKRVFYKQLYDRDPTGKYIQYLETRSIQVTQI